MNGCLTLTPSLGVISYEYRYRLYLQKLDRLFILPNAENRTTVSSFVWTEHRNVTDRQTDGDGQTESIWLLQRSVLRAMRTRCKTGWRLYYISVSVYIDLCIRLCALSRSHFLIDFHQNWHRRKNSQK